jgi:hypothetical protein
MYRFVVGSGRSETVYKTAKEAFDGCKGERVFVECNGVRYLVQKP